MLGDHAYVVTGSVAGSALVWDAGVGPARVRGGPFAEVDEFAVETSGMQKMGPEPTSDVDVALHPSLGLTVSIVADALRVVRVEDGHDFDVEELGAKQVISAAVGSIGSITAVAVGCHGGRIVVGQIVADDDGGNAHLLADSVIDHDIARGWIPRAGLGRAHLLSWTGLTVLRPST